MPSDSPIRYIAIYDVLRKRLQTLTVNMLLPTENELAEEFLVSRVTIRQALGHLDQAGLIERVRGTVVSPPKIIRNNIPMTTLEDDFRRQGIPFETKILVFDKNAEAPRSVAAALNLQRRSRVGYLRLARIVERHIVCCEHRYLLAGLARRLEAEAILSQGLVQVVSNLVGIPIAQVEFETEILPSSSQPVCLMCAASGQ